MIKVKHLNRNIFHVSVVPFWELFCYNVYLCSVLLFCTTVELFLVQEYQYVQRACTHNHNRHTQLEMEAKIGNNCHQCSLFIPLLLACCFLPYCLLCMPSHEIMLSAFCFVFAILSWACCEAHASNCGQDIR